MQVIKILAYVGILNYNCSSFNFLRLYGVDLVFCEYSDCSFFCCVFHDYMALIKKFVDHAKKSIGKKLSYEDYLLKLKGLF